MLNCCTCIKSRGEAKQKCERCHSNPAEPGSSLCLECRIELIKGVHQDNRIKNKTKIARTRKWRSKKANKPDAYRARTGRIYYSNISLPETSYSESQASDHLPPAIEVGHSSENELISFVETQVELNARLQCRNCGTEIHELDNYCTSCGCCLQATPLPLGKARKIKVNRSIFDSTESLATEGFRDFYSLSHVRANPSLIPKEKGVYLILYPYPEPPEFLPVGTGGWFKGQNPNVDLDSLKSKWVERAIVVYIGQAGGERDGLLSSSTLRRRIKAYLEFGQGKKRGHRGGRYIWQIRDPDRLLVCWKTLQEGDINARTIEAQLLSEFEEKYGRIPFANLQG